MIPERGQMKSNFLKTVAPKIVATPEPSTAVSETVSEEVEEEQPIEVVTP